MQTLLQILLYSANRIINPPEFPIIAQPELTAKALNDEAGSQLMVGVSNPHTSRPAEPDASSQRLPSANAHSPTADTIIPQNPNKSQISSENSRNQAQESKQPRADEILFNGYKEIRKEQESNITQTTQQASVDGADIDTNTSPRGPRR